MKGQVVDAEQYCEDGKSLDVKLHIRLDEEMQRALHRDEPVGVGIGLRAVRDDEVTRELVEPVQGEASRCLHPERMPHGQPGTEQAEGSVVSAA